jgi:hypothetical protein
MEVSGQFHDPAALPQGKEPPIPVGYEAGWAPEPVWTLWNTEKSCPYPGIEPRLAYNTNKYRNKTRIAVSWHRFETVTRQKRYELKQLALYTVA